MAKPLNPDPYTNPKANSPTTQHTLDHHLKKNHYTAACHKASAGKAPGPVAIPNEILKHLPVSAYDLLCLLFRLMARYSYAPKKWCISATKLIYKPSKTDPHNPSNYRPIALMNGILKLWTSILTSIGNQTTESEGIFTDTADGFRSHRNIYDNLSTHIM